MDSCGKFNQRRSHLKKEERLPKCYKDTEKILKQIKSCKMNVKTALAKSRLRGGYFNKVYSLVMKILNNYDVIQKIVDKAELLQKENFLRKEIAIILVYELIFGKGQLVGSSKPVISVLRYHDIIMDIFKNIEHDSAKSYTVPFIPRYARIHTLVTSVSDVIKSLKKIGFQQTCYDESIAEKKYIKLVKKLTKGYFLQDFHFKDILVFAPDENLVSLELFHNCHIFLQDKASCIPVHVLNPKPGCVVLDACAAPGMKTLHIASKMKNKGILLATELAKDRFESLKQFLAAGDVKNAKVYCKDFTSIDPHDQAYSNVEYVLLDPSCSGSGMVNRMDFVTDMEDSKTKSRLKKLSGFQITLLKHALRFPSVKRIVYSTCSVNEEENEYVVHEALKHANNNFELVAAMPEWSCRGLENYEYGHLCLRASSEKHLTNGFFVAVFERTFHEKLDFSNKEKKQKN